MGLLLDISPRTRESYASPYFALYIVTDPGSVRELQKKQMLNEKKNTGICGKNMRMISKLARVRKPLKNSVS